MSHMEAASARVKGSVSRWPAS